MDSSMTFLNHIHIKASANQDFLRQLIGKTEDNEFAKVIFKRIEEYQKIQEKSAELISDEFGCAEVQGRISKGAASIWNTVRTMVNSKSSHIADIIVRSMKVDIYEMTKMINKYDGKDTHVLDVAGMYISAGEKTVDKLQCYLE